MRIDLWLRNSQKQLKTAGISSARLDCLLLLEDALGKNRAHLLANPEAEISEKTEVALNKKIAQRQQHLPIAYIRGHVQFYGREFIITPAVLVPRPETEDTIGLAKNIVLPENPVITDIGTGSGCIGITLALELPTKSKKIYLYDLDEAALAIARQNAKKHKVRIFIDKQNLAHQLPSNTDLVVANLPYVPIKMPINNAAQYEPAHAIFSGIDGLDAYRIFWEQLRQHQPKNVITEALPMQHQALQILARAAGYNQTAIKGYAQHFRLD